MKAHLLAIWLLFALVSLTRAQSPGAVAPEAVWQNLNPGTIEELTLQILPGEDRFIRFREGDHHYVLSNQLIVFIGSPSEALAQLRAAKSISIIAASPKNKAGTGADIQIERIQFHY